MSEKYDYIIDTEKLSRPLGRMRYAAKVTGLVRILGPGRTERVNLAFQEHWGVTEDEAYEKARREVEDWIGNNP